MTGILGKQPIRSSGVVGAFASTGIDDNADATAITIASDESVTLSGDLVPSTPLSHRNHLINGAMMVDQRMEGNTYTSTDGANNDDIYTLDRWLLLSDGNDIVDVSRGAAITTDGMKAMGLQVENTNKKFGIAQIVENFNCGGLIGNEVTFSFKAKVSAVDKLDNIKAGIIAWSSTKDAVTSDVVSAWGADGTTPTLASNLTFENTPANLNVTTTTATYSVSATIDTSSTTNIIVFIWSDVLDTTAGQYLYISDCQLERGSVATPFEHRSYGEELARCMRYYQTWGGNSGSERFFVTFAISTSQHRGDLTLSPTMRIAPTLSVSDAGDLAIERYGTNRAAQSVNFDQTSTKVASFVINYSSGFDAGEGAHFIANGTTDARVKLTAEL